MTHDLLDGLMDVVFDASRLGVGGREDPLTGPGHAEDAGGRP